MSVNVAAMQDAAYSNRIDAGIRIYEICDSSETNPRPDSDHELSLGEFVSTQKLKDITGCSNLFDVMELKLKVDTNETSIGNIGAMIPNLKKLNLNNSYITSIRDLGTSFSNLSMAWLCRCSLSELDGISSLTSLKELYLAFNEISDLSPLTMLDTLEVVDLEANNVNDVMQVEFLALCNNLVNLTMKGNPVETAPTPDTKDGDLKFYSYQDAILSRLPSLTVLDDENLLVEKVNGVEVKRVNPTKTKVHYSNDLKIIADSLKSLDIEENEDVSEDIETARPKSAQRRLRSARSPARQPPKQTVQQNVPKGDDYTNWKNATKKETSQKVSFAPTNVSSDLTKGGIMCGNPVSALRQRKRQKLPPQQRAATADGVVNLTSSVNKSRSATSFVPEHSYLTKHEIGSSEESKEDVFEELKRWRLNNQVLFDESNNNSTTTNRDDNVVQQASKSSSDSHLPSKDVCRPSFSPAPPSKPRKSRTPTRTRRSLPSPPASPAESSERPHTVAEMRADDIQSYDVRDSLIKEDEETTFENVKRPCGSPTIQQHPVRQSESFTNNRPSTARAALQSLQRPNSRTT